MTDKLIALTIGTGVSPIPIQAPPVLPQGNILETIFTNGVTLLIIAVIVISLFFIIIAGISWTTSGGDEKQIEGAKGRLKYAIIGLILTLASFFIILLIGHFFGIRHPLSFNF